MCKKEPKMDYQQILQEQMKETLDADAFDALTKQVAEYSGGMAYCIMLFDDCRIFDGHVESAEWHHFGSQVEMFLVQACF